MTALSEAAAALGIALEEAEELLGELDLDDLGEEDLAALDEIEEQDRSDPHLAMSVNDCGYGVMALAPWARMVIHSTAVMLAVIGANRIGKTFLLAWELIAIALDRHPVIKRVPGVRDTVVLVLPDKEGSWGKDISPAILKLLPDGVLHRRCKYWPDRGFRVGMAPMLLFTNGFQVTIKTSTQTGRSQAGGEGIVALYYNEPPTSNTYEETLRQATDVSGGGPPTYVRFYTTPFDVDQPLDWAEEAIRGDGLEPVTSTEPVEQPTGWMEFRVPLLPENVPHRTPRSIEVQKQRMSKATHAQRIWARWRGPKKDRAMTLWSGDQTFGLPASLWAPNRRLRRALAALTRALPGVEDNDELRFGVGIDHGQGPGKQVYILVAWVGEGTSARVWVLASYRNTGQSSVQADVEGFVAVLERWGLGVLDISRWRGDINAKINDTIAAALREHEPRWHGTVEKADKSEHSIEYGMHILNDALGREVAGGPALRVYEGCQDVVGAFETHKGKSKHEPTKDVMDAVRYIAVDLLAANEAPGFEEANPDDEYAYASPDGGWLASGDDF